MNARLHKEDIKAAIRKRNLTLTDVARHAGVDESLVSHVLAGRNISANVEEALAEASGYSLEDVQQVTRKFK